jgi:hypothetical protein
MSTRSQTKARFEDFSIANITGIVLVWYLIAVGVSRLITMVISPGIGVVTGVYHYHHVLWGLIAMSVGGFIGLYWESKFWRIVGSWFLGLGLGLCVDEVGLILVTSNDGYWDPITYPVIVLVAEILFIAMMAARQQGR